MVTVKDAFVDAWRSYRIGQGDDPSSLPDPLAHERERRRQEKRGKRRRRSEAREEEEAAAGGFLVEEEQDGQSAGGFLPEGDSDEGGGFLPEEGETAERGAAQAEAGDSDQEGQAPQHIPLASVPDALATLALPSSDETVLKLFRDVAVNEEVAEAAGAVEGSRRRRRGAGASSKIVSLPDFERIVEVLLAGQNGETQGDGSDEEVESKSRRSQRPRRAAAASSLKRLKASKRETIEIDDDDDEEDSEDEDAFKVDADVDEEDDGAFEAEEVRPTPARRKRGGAASRAKAEPSQRRSASGGVRRVKRARPASDESDDEDGSSLDDTKRDTKLSAHQRKQVLALFQLVTGRMHPINGAARGTSGSPADERISKHDLRALVRAVGEKIPDKEVDEMIDEGIHYFAAASSSDMTRQSAKLRREAAAGRAAAAGLADQGQTLGIDEFAGVLLKGRLI